MRSILLANLKQSNITEFDCANNAHRYNRTIRSVGSQSVDGSKSIFLLLFFFQDMATVILVSSYAGDFSFFFLYCAVLDKCMHIHKYTNTSQFNSKTISKIIIINVSHTII